MSKRVMMMMIVCCSVRVIVLIAADVYMSFIRMCVCQCPLFSNTTEKKRCSPTKKKQKNMPKYQSSYIIHFNSPYR